MFPSVLLHALYWLHSSRHCPVFGWDNLTKQFKRTCVLSYGHLKIIEYHDKRLIFSSMELSLDVHFNTYDLTKMQNIYNPMPINIE